MIRKAFVMPLHAGSEEEYERRHRAIWPGLAEALRSHGVTRYSIFVDERMHLLFAYAEIESEDRWRALAETDICRRWWLYMADLMPTQADSSPVARDLREVFHQV